MRRLALVVALLALPTAWAAEEYVTLVDWQDGHALAPTSSLVSSPLADEYALLADACHPTLALDLLYDPASLDINVDDVGSASLSYEFRAEVWHNGSMVIEQRVTRSGYGIPLGMLDEAGEHTLRLSLGVGADVDYRARLRGRLLHGDPACDPPIG